MHRVNFNSRDGFAGLCWGGLRQRVFEKEELQFKDGPNPV